jgi:RNA polymerase sigma-70 factor (ECF subfamily)
MTLFRKKYKNFSDEKLLEFIQQKNSAGEKAFDELYERYSQRLLHYFHRMLGGPNDRAQDFLQDLFLKIVERPESFNPALRFRTWIYTVAHNMCKNEYRRREVTKVVEHTDNIEALSAETKNIESALEQRLFQQALLLELEKLEENHRTTFLLRHQNDFSIKEISEVLGCAEGTTKSRLFYATKKLARQLRAFHPHGSEVQQNEYER